MNATDSTTCSCRRYVLIMVVCYAVWIVLYFTTAWIGELRGPAFHPALPVDESFPLIPEFFFCYVLAYVIVLGVFIIRRTPAFLNFAYVSFIAMNLTAFTLFVLFPAQGPERVIAEEGSHILAALHGIDSRYNAFPSLHVANPWLIALLALHERRMSLISLLFISLALLISVSTLFIHQHYLLDVLGGIALAVLVMSITVRLPISEKHW